MSSSFGFSFLHGFVWTPLVVIALGTNQTVADTKRAESTAQFTRQVEEFNRRCSSTTPEERNLCIEYLRGFIDGQSWNGDFCFTDKLTPEALRQKLLEEIANQRSIDFAGWEPIESMLSGLATSNFLRGTQDASGCHEPALAQ